MLFQILRLLIILIFGLVTYFTSLSFYPGSGSVLPYVYTFLAILAGTAGSFFPDLFRSKITASEAFGVTVGLGLGFLSTGVLVFISMKIPGSAGSLGPVSAIIVGAFITLYSMRAGMRYLGSGLMGGGLAYTENSTAEIPASGVIPKALDTSVIIDGRILDISDTYFIDGPIYIPNFVLREIQLISDSPDPIKRARGRRGLEMLNKLIHKGSLEVKIIHTDYTETREVDAKLVKLCMETGYRLLTNDFNLHKVAELQGIKVLNLNNLANALKPVVLPGEELNIQVMKEGKDDNQGIGYLEDGTMVVVENGHHLLGKEVRVNVTSIIQTAAGKMIFTKVKENSAYERKSHSNQNQNQGQKQNANYQNKSDYNRSRGGYNKNRNQNRNENQNQNPNQNQNSNQNKSEGRGGNS